MREEKKCVCEINLIYSTYDDMIYIYKIYSFE